jgi:pimeloyl-ACP methyl ester carboxylesterase
MTTDEGTHRHTTPMLPSVHAPTLVIMGSKDPDFPDPAAEARFTADSLGGPTEVLMVEGVGHYPQTEAVTEVADAVAAFVAKAA